MGATIGISLPTQTVQRWTADGNNMVQQFTQMGYKVDLQFANNNVQKQVSQVQGMVKQGDKLLVISAVDGSSMTSVLAGAAQKKIPVIAYDRLLTGTKNVTCMATFDNVRVGQIQGQLLVDRLGLSRGAKGPFNLEMFAGDTGDANAHSFYTGAMKVLAPYLKSGKLVVRSGQTTFAQVTTKNYDAGLAGRRMSSLVTQYYSSAKLSAVLSPYDGMTIGIIKALQADGYGTTAKPLPVTSGQDAELPSVKSIIAGQQTATIYKDTRELANDTTSFNNGAKVVPTYLLYPIAVDKANYQTLLVGGGYYTAAQLRSCTDQARRGGPSEGRVLSRAEEARLFLPVCRWRAPAPNRAVPPGGVLTRVVGRVAV